MLHESIADQPAVFSAGSSLVNRPWNAARVKTYLISGRNRMRFSALYFSDGMGYLRGQTMLRKCLVLIVMIVLVFPVTLARADSMDDVFCGDLSQSDCQILLDNAAVMDDLNSFAVSVTMAIEVDAVEPMRLFVQGDGQFELDDESLQTINTMAATASEAEWGELAEVFLTSAKAVVSVEMTEFSGEEEVQSEFQLAVERRGSGGKRGRLVCLDRRRYDRYGRLRHRPQ